MDGEHPQWGPNKDNYISTFNDRINTAYDNYLSSRETTAVAHQGLIPLPLLETMLAVGENLHKIGFQHGSHSLTILTETIRRYSKLQKGNVSIQLFLRVGYVTIYVRFTRQDIQLLLWISLH